MQFKVPQNVQREDTILWFITLRQLILLLGGGGISYFLYVQLSKVYELTTLEVILILVPFLVTVAFAFLKIKSMSLMQFILTAIEQFLFRAPRRFWSQEGNILISMTTRLKSAKASESQSQEKQPIGTDKIKKLAEVLDAQRQKKTASSQSI